VALTAGEHMVVGWKGQTMRGRRDG